MFFFTWILNRFYRRPPPIKDRKITVIVQIDENEYSIECFTRDKISIIGYYMNRDHKIDISNRIIYLEGVVINKNNLFGQYLDVKDELLCLTIV